MSTLRTRLADLVAHAEASDLPDLLADLEAAKALAYAKLLAPPTVPAPLPELQTAEQIAEQTGLPASWLRAAARAGTIPHRRYGAHLKFRLADVLAAGLDQPPLRRKRAGFNTSSTGRPKKARNTKDFSPAATAVLPPANGQDRERKDR